MDSFGHLAPISVSNDNKTEMYKLKMFAYTVFILDKEIGGPLAHHSQTWWGIFYFQGGGLKNISKILYYNNYNQSRPENFMEIYE